MEKSKLNLEIQSSWQSKQGLQDYTNQILEVFIADSAFVANSLDLN